MIRISVDFNTLTSPPIGKILIPTHVQPELLEFLRPGLQVTLYEENDFQVEAIVESDELYGIWYGIPDWTTINYLNTRFNLQ